MISNAAAFLFAFFFWVGLITVVVMIAGVLLGVYCTISLNRRFARAQHDHGLEHVVQPVRPVDAFLAGLLGGDQPDYERDEEETS